MLDRTTPRPGIYPKDAPDWHGRVFDQHLMREAPVRSFLFMRNVPVKNTTTLEHVGANPAFKSFSVVETARYAQENSYHFTLTWTPGQIVLTGDIGEMTLTHYHALARFESGIDWAATSDYDYLLGKSHAQREYDATATRRQIIRWANEEAIECLNGRVGFHYGRSIQDRAPHRIPGMRQDLQVWRREVRDAKIAGLPDDELPERPDQYCGINQVWAAQKTHSYTDPVLKRWHVPDTWERWAAIWQALGGRDEPSNVTMAYGRRDLKDDLDGNLETPESAYNFLSEIGFDDYYGEHVWSSNTLLKIKAIMWGAQQINATLDRSEASHG